MSAASSFPTALLPSLRPSARREAELSVAHTLSPLDCHLRSDPQDSDKAH